MLKKIVLYATLALMILSAMPMLVVVGQENECDAFESGSDAERTSYYMGEGAAFIRSSNFASAIRSYTCIIEDIDSDYADAYYNRAAAHTARRSFEDALEDYGQVLSLEPSNFQAFNNRGVVYAADGEYELALADFSSALDADDAYIPAIINRGIVSTIQGDLDSAEADFLQVIELGDLEAVIADLQDPERDPEAPLPEYDQDAVLAYALLGIVQSQRASTNYDNYLFLAGGNADGRVQSAAGALESRFEFELRFDDGSWFLLANLADS